MELEQILSQIAEGRTVDPKEFLPFLCLPERAERAEVNARLARAYFQTGRQNDIAQARVFIHRAWLLNRFSPAMLPLYKEILAANNDIAGIREAYKRIGIEFVAQGNISAAVEYFNQWQYAYAEFLSVDKYDYDFDVMQSMDRLAAQFRFRQKKRRLKNRNLRIAYLLKGARELGSVLIQLNLLFAKHHDRERVDVTFFVPESECTVLGSPDGEKIRDRFRDFGYELRMAPELRDTGKRLLEVARNIYKTKPDVMIVSAALAEFEHYFIAALKPAPITIGLVQGPPQQFAPPMLDWGIAWNKRPLMDAPVNCFAVHMEEDLPNRSAIEALDRAELNIPADACVLASAGRHFKFQDRQFWQAVAELLAENREAWFLALGVEQDQLPFLSELLTDEVRGRMRFIGWRGSDYLRVLCSADIFLDTFPSGGGGVLVDAMALGVPVVSFRDDYLKLYDQTDWSPAEEIFDIPELIVERRDFGAMQRVVTKLIRDPEYRRTLGDRAQAYMLAHKGTPARAVRSCENLYFQIVESLT